MVARLILLCLLTVPLSSVQAASKTHAKAKPAEPQSSLNLTPQALQAGVQRFIKEEADCGSVTFESVRTQKKGAVIRQKLEREGAKVDMTLEVAKSGKVSNARFAAPTKDPAHLTVMLCGTYALMRTLQPNPGNPAVARQAALDLWQQAQQKTYTKALGNAKFRAQMAPFEVNAF